MEYKFKLLKGKCPSAPDPEEGGPGFSLIPDDTCMNALHAVFPYFLTLTNGGWFTWVDPGDGVSPEPAVEISESAVISTSPIIL